VIRAAALCLALTSPAAAWEFTPGQPCLLTHEFHSSVANEDISVVLSYDPIAPLYSLSITRSGQFLPAAYFSMTFLLGERPIRIQTTHHSFSADRKTLTVEDSGFGNVLDGMQFNATVMAGLANDLTAGAGRYLEIPLVGAADPVAAFRSCAPAAGA